MPSPFPGMDAYLENPEIFSCFTNQEGPPEILATPGAAPVP